MFTVAPPAGSGSARVRRESTVSDGEDVFEEEKEKKISPSSRKEDASEAAKLVPAPPPKENIWEKRKQGGSATSPAKPDDPVSQNERSPDDRKHTNHEV